MRTLFEQLAIALTTYMLLSFHPTLSFVVVTKHEHVITTLPRYIHVSTHFASSNIVHSKLRESVKIKTTTTTILLCQLLGMNCASESQFLVNFWSSQQQQKQQQQLHQIQNNNNKEMIMNSIGTETRTTTTMLKETNNNDTSTSSWLLWNDFCQRGGNTDIHSDGWGLTYYIGNGIRQFHDVEAASTSLLADFIGKQPIITRNLLAHIRYATAGEVNMANVHPFTREMWAVNWCFCHNGHVPLFIDQPEYVLGRSRKNNDHHNNENNDDNNNEQNSRNRFYYSIGDTDSEATFCAMLNALRSKFHTTMPSLPILYEEIQLLCEEIVQYNPSETIFNFLLTCGPHVLWVYSWPGKRPNSNVWNGLHYSVKNNQQSVNVTDEDINVKISVNKQQKRKKNNNMDKDHTINKNYNDNVNVETHNSNNNICIVATKPLTNDPDDWIEIRRGELIVLDEGIPHVTPTELFRIELQGHGINNEKRILSPPKLIEDMRRYSVNPEFFIGGGI